MTMMNTNRMKAVATVLLGAVVLGGLGVDARGGPIPRGPQAVTRPAPLPPEATATARNVVGFLAGRPLSEKAMRFRVQGAAAAGALSLESPLTVYRVSTATLKHFRAQDDPTSLLTGGAEALYPVAVGGAVHTSVEVRLERGAWRQGAIGMGTLASQLVAARAQDMQNSRQSVDAYCEVWIPGLGLHFLGRLLPGSFVLIPVRSETAIGLRAGVAYPAAEVFQKLAPWAAATDGKMS